MRQAPEHKYKILLYSIWFVCTGEKENTFHQCRQVAYYLFALPNHSTYSANNGQYDSKDIFNVIWV